MNCPRCQSSTTKVIKSTTELGYQEYRCCSCGSQFNERTGTPYNYIQYPTEVVIITMYFYCRFKNSLDDVVELMSMRGIHLSDQTVHNWVHRFGVMLAIEFRKNRRDTNGKKWHVDSTYIKVEGCWCYLYRAIDSDGNLVDVYLSDVRDQKAAEDFFLQAEATAGITPDKITTDKEPALAAAHEEVFGNGSKHENCKFKNNIIESSHRGIKSRYRSMKGFKNIFSALKFCTVFEEIQQHFRLSNKSRAEKRGLVAPQFLEFKKIAQLAA